MVCGDNCQSMVMWTRRRLISWGDLLICDFPFFCIGYAVVTSIFYWSWLRPRDHRKSAILQKDKYISGYGKKLFSELVTLPR